MTPQRARTGGAFAGLWETRTTLFGAWLTAPSIAGPGVFESAGYDYLGIDIQHSYMDDADAARLLRSIGSGKIATVVRMTSGAPEPIGRVLDAGADGIIVPMVNTVEDAIAAVAATRYAPRGPRSFGPLRSDLGFDVAELESRVSVFVMIETDAALAAVDEICRVPGLAGIYIGPADLAISQGVSPSRAMTSDVVLGAIGRALESATTAGVKAGIHAGRGETGAELMHQGFDMVTLGSEGQTLRRGAIEELADARREVIGEAEPVAAVFNPYS